MRKQTRPEEPEVLRSHQEKWNRQWRELRGRNPSAKFAWYETGGKSAREWILQDLRGMNQGHCSFCDGYPVETVTSEPVEHFRPKSNPKFHDLAFAWDNLFYCCNACQSHKGEQWDDHLIKPDEPCYEFDRYFRFLDGRIEPVSGCDETVRLRAEATIRIFGLNERNLPRHRKLELRKWSRTTAPVLDDFAFRDFLEAG